VTIVWIAERFTDEHRAALDWLNEATRSEISFFGIEVELGRIGDPPPAPKFNVMSRAYGTVPPLPAGLTKIRSFSSNTGRSSPNSFGPPAARLRPPSPPLSTG